MSRCAAFAVSTSATSRATAATEPRRLQKEIVVLVRGGRHARVVLRAALMVAGERVGRQGACRERGAPLIGAVLVVASARPQDQGSPHAA
jgi:hypothetical protein